MVDEVSKVKTISDAMQEIDELAKSLSSKSDDNLLICAALLAVTRQHYIEALGVEQTSFIFQSVVESFDYYNGYGENLDVPVTIH
jgi:DNA helicase TIP49 (TBP-interacting protein)